MSPSNKSARRPGSSAIENEILAELQAAPWDKPFQKSIDELGAVIGSNIGSTRRRNEDRLAVAQIMSASRELFTVAMVCDGVGSSEMGDIAATLAISMFLAELSAVREPRPLSLLLIDLIRKVDDGVRAELNGRGTTTMCVLLASGNGQLAAANVGDSRIFSWSDEGSHFEQISIDDTIENELRDLKISAPSLLEARGLHGALSQAIGETGRAAGSLRISTYSRERFSRGVVLATDGTWRAAEGGFKTFAAHTSSAFDFVRRTLAFATWTGGIDNASIVAIENLETFSRGWRNSFRKEAGSPKIRIWVCDTKVVFREALPNTFRDFKQDEPLRRKVAPEKKTKRRPDSEREEQPPTGKDPQLNLNVDSKERTQRPKIEISTDD